MTRFSTSRFGLTIATLVLAVALPGQAPPATAELMAKFEAYMTASVRVKQFSGAVLVSRNGETIFARGYGFANVEHQVPNTPRTKFRLGSITKQFTAMAILILKDSGKLALDAPIGKYLDDAPKAWDGVTIHHLLTHTGGIPSFTSAPDYLKKMMMPETVKSMIARFRDKPLDFAPGKKFSYSNSGYFLLGAIIERVTGNSYEAYLKEAIFDPLEMKDTGYDHFATLLPNRASGYTREGDKLENADYLDMSQPYAAGSLYSTVEDLAKWDRALTAEKLITKDSYAKMYTPVKSNYAYGWVVTDKPHRELSHAGGINGFVTEIVRLPDEHLCVIVLCNVLPMNPGRAAHDLAAIALGEKYEHPKERQVATVAPKLLAEYVGKYQLEDKVTMAITQEGEHLMAQVTGQPKLEIFPESETLFFFKVVEATVQFVRDDKGRVTHLMLHQGRRDTKATRIQMSVSAAGS